MNSSVGFTKIIDAGSLDSENYFSSLTEEGYNKGLLQDNVIERIQRELIELLIYKTKMYTSGDSSSVPVETAHDIMESNLFTVGIWLKTYENPDEAIKALENTSIQEIYKKGRKRIDTLVLSAKTLHQKLLEELIDTKNVFYCDTMKGGILGFFKLYYPDFFAQEKHITADYPLYNNMPKLKGIEFIKKYIENAYYENMFCKYFYPEAIHSMMRRYIYDYEEYLINIYEQVLFTALGCVMAGKDFKSLEITDEDIRHIYGLLGDMTKEQIYHLVIDSGKILTEGLDCPSGLKTYIKGSFPEITSRINVWVKEMNENAKKQTYDL